MNKRSFWSFVRGGVVGTAVSAAVVALAALSSQTTTHADSPGSPTWVVNGIYEGAACSNWRDDNDYFPGTTTPFSYYWSGSATWWNLSTANACWHNDEGGSTWWRAIDIPAGATTPVVYHARIYAANYTPGQIFGGTYGCSGVGVDMYNPYGGYSGSMHYWHISPGANVVGTGWADHWYFANQTDHLRTVGTVLAHASDSCTNTGDHVHQAVYQGGWAQPNKEGAAASLPMSFGW